MNVIALIRSVTLTNNNGKPGALVCLEVENPLEIIEVRLNKMHIAEGIEKALAACEGQVVQVPLALESFNGRTELKFPLGAKFTPPAMKKAG